MKRTPLRRTAVQRVPERSPDRPRAHLIPRSLDGCGHPLCVVPLVIEIVSPGDESWGKLEFYAANGVEELLVVDPQEKTVSWLGLEDREYRHLKHSRVIELGGADLAQRIDPGVAPARRRARSSRAAALASMASALIPASAAPANS